MSRRRRTVRCVRSSPRGRSGGGVRGPDPEAERGGGGDHRQEDVVGGQFTVGDGLLVKVMPSILGMHNAFRQARGSRCRVDQKTGRRGGPPVTVRTSSPALCRWRDRRRRGPLPAPQPRLPLERPEGGAILVADQKRGLGGPQDLCGLPHTGARSEPDAHRTTALDRHQQDVNGNAVAVPDSHPVARAYAQ